MSHNINQLEKDLIDYLQNLMNSEEIKRYAHLRVYSPLTAEECLSDLFNLQAKELDLPLALFHEACNDAKSIIDAKGDKTPEVIKDFAEAVGQLSDIEYNNITEFMDKVIARNAIDDLKAKNPFRPKS